MYLLPEGEVNLTCSLSSVSKIWQRGRYYIPVKGSPRVHKTTWLMSVCLSYFAEDSKWRRCRLETVNGFSVRRKEGTKATFVCLHFFFPAFKLFCARLALDGIGFTHMGIVRVIGSTVRYHAIRDILSYLLVLYTSIRWLIEDVEGGWAWDNPYFISTI